MVLNFHTTFMGFGLDPEKYTVGEISYIYIYIYIYSLVTANYSLKLDHSSHDKLFLPQFLVRTTCLD